MVDAVEIVRKALWDSWFPNGHAGETYEDFEEDLNNWQEIAVEDAQTAVTALVEARLICNTAQDVYDEGQSEDK